MRHCLGTNLPPPILVDGLNLLWRAAYGFPARIRDSEGEDVTPAFGFFVLLRKAIHGLMPCEAVVVFDGEGSSDARVEMAPDYKAKSSIAATPSRRRPPPNPPTALRRESRTQPAW